MSTPKRERQRENRQIRRAADEAAAKQYTTRRRVKLIGSAAVIFAAFLAVMAFIQRGDDSEEPASAPEPADTATTTSVAEPADTATTTSVAEPADAAPSGCPEPDGSSGRVIDFDGPQPMCIDPGAAYAAVFDTSEGEIRFDLTADATPLTVNNFVTLARWGYYDDTLLFRTDPSIDIIQGGSPHTNTASDPGPGYNIEDEPPFEGDEATGPINGPYRYEPGQLVMARGPGFNSGSAQFFLTTGPNTSKLDGQGTYMVFGHTDDAGLEVAQSIIGLHEDTDSGLGGAPSRDVIVRSVRIEETPAGG